MKSIRNQLLLILFIVLTVVWILVTAITYLESQDEVEEVFDSEMAQSAAVLSQLTNLQLDKQDAATHQLQKEVYGHRYEKKLAFQIWRDGQLILRSASAPARPMASQPGYSVQTLNHEQWRVFTLRSSEHETIHVAEKLEVREELIGEITMHSLYPLTLALPVLALLIWLSLGQALKPLRKLATEIAQRSSHNLAPVTDRDDIPGEITPIILSLNRLFSQVDSALQREKRFTSDASHELRTPLASIKIQAQVAMRANDDEQRQHALGQILQSVDRTTHLVEQMLTLARLDPEAAAEQFGELELGELVNDVIGEFRSQASAKNITLSCEHHPSSITLFGDDTALAILLRNLVNNALTYSPPGSEVTVKTRQTEHDITLMVIDNGPGIPPQERDSVFNRFHRGENTQHQQGSGLGLSIVRRIAELHRAQVTITDNSQGRGISINVIFPR